MPAICRDCIKEIPNVPRCPHCRGPRVLFHPELFDLSIAHMDCDAFYASVEKRDNPELRDKPVIIGGGRRGVVSTACYIARISGVRSAMPMYKAKRLCPQAVVIAPRMAVYAKVSRQIRAFMDQLSPIVEPLSLDEAFIDLSGTERLHGQPAALSMAGLVRRMQQELGLSGSVGLSHNKFLAKLASDFEKPRGFSVLGRDNLAESLAPMPVKLIWGVGKVLQARLAQDGINRFGDIAHRERKALIESYGQMGDRLWHLAQGLDYRDVQAKARVKSISNETTFETDIAKLFTLEGHLWRMAIKVSDRAKASAQVGQVVTLKVKRADHKILTRRMTLRRATQSVNQIYDCASLLLKEVMPQAPFRLLGVGLSHLDHAQSQGDYGDLLDENNTKQTKAEYVSDEIRNRFGHKAIMRGRALR